MAGTEPRFGLIPLPLSKAASAVPNEFLIDPNTSHIYIKKADGSLYSKTVELENRLNAMVRRSELVDDVIIIPGSRLAETTTDTSLLSISAIGATITGDGGIYLNQLSMAYSKKYIYVVDIEFISTNPSVIIACNMRSRSYDNVNSSSFGPSMTSQYDYGNGRYIRRSVFDPKNTYAGNGQCYPVIMPGATVGIGTIIDNVIFRKIPIGEQVQLYNKVYIDYTFKYNNYIDEDNTNARYMTSTKVNPLTIKYFNLQKGIYSLTMALNGTASTSKVDIDIRFGGISHITTIDFSKISALSSLDFKLATIAVSIPSTRLDNITITPKEDATTLTIPYIEMNMINTALYDHSIL